MSPLPFAAHDSNIPIGRAVLSMALSLFLAGGALSRASDNQTSELPEPPRLAFEKFPPAIRAVIQQAHDALLAHPLDASANGKLGMVLHAHGFPREAEVCYRRARLLDPKSFRWAYYLGLVQMDQAKCDEATATFREALRLDPDYFPAQLRLGQCLLVSLDWDEAGKLYEELLLKHPDSAESHYGLGRVRAGRNDFDGAVESFRKACQLFPKFASAHFALARAYQRLGKADRAQEELALSRKGEGALPATEDGLLAEVHALYRDFNEYLKLGSALGDRGKFKDAADAYEQALAINPELPEAHTRLVYLYGQLGEVAKAEEHFQAAVRLDPGKAEAYFNHGVVVMGQGRTREAEEAFGKAVQIKPLYAEAHNNLGYLLEGQGKLSEAVTEFRKALEASPDFPQAHFSLGRILVKQENYEDGIPHLLKALGTEEDDNKASYLYAAGVAYADVGDLQNGVRYMRLAREKAATHHQSKLLESIDDDLRLLEGEASPQ